jgi:hypothetical protein
MYPDDHNGVLVPNIERGSPDDVSWVVGQLNFAANHWDNTNTLYLTDSRYARLSPYTARNAGIYKCPSDQSMVQIFNQRLPRVRSVAMRVAVGGSGGEGRLNHHGTNPQDTKSFSRHRTSRR